MKILIVAPPYIEVPPKSYGGTEWVISNTVEELVRQGHQVTLYATGNSKTKANLQYVFETGLADQQIPWEGGLAPLVHYDQAFKIADSYDIVHLHASSGNDLMMFPYIAKLKIPHIVTFHVHAPVDRYSGTDQLMIQYYGKYVNGTAISKIMEKNLPKGINSFGHIYNSIDVNAYSFSKTNGDEKYVTWIGKIVPDKGLHHAINVAKTMNTKLKFGGIVDKNSKDSVEYFRDHIEKHIDNELIEYIGPVNTEQKNELFGNAIAFLNPIDWVEPFGMVIVESLACGTPVISFARGAAVEIIEDGISGFLVKDESEMIKAIKKLNSIKRENCRKRVCDTFSPAATTKSLLKKYGQVINLHKYESKISNIVPVQKYKMT